MDQSQSDQFEMSAPFLTDGQENPNRKPLLLEKVGSDSKTYKNFSFDTPGFQRTINLESIDQGAILQTLYDDGEQISGNKDGKLQKNIRKPNIFWERNYQFMSSLQQPSSFFSKFNCNVTLEELGWRINYSIFFCYSHYSVLYNCLFKIFAESTKNIIDLICFLMLFLDLLLEFLTAFYEHGNLITDKNRIAQQYFKTWLFFDLIAVISFGIVSLLNEDEATLLLLLFYLKYPALLKIDYLFEEATLLHRSIRTIYNVGKIIVFLQFCFLMFSCIFYVIGYACVEAGYNSWLLNDGNFGVISQMEPSFHFFFSYYFGLGTMTTTMGYGDITPLNVFECTWCLGGIFFAVFIFQVNVNSLFKIMEEFNVHPIRIFKKRIAINRFMQSKQVPLNVQERVRRYLNEHWFEEGTRDLQLEQEVFAELAPEVKEELFFNSFGNFFNEVSFFHQILTQQCLMMLSTKIEEISYSQSEIIFEDKTTKSVDDFSFYFIDFGEVLIYANLDSTRPYWIKQLKQRDYFGEWSFLTGRPRKASATTLQYSRLYKISRINLLEVLSNFPDDYERYWMLRDRLIFSKDCSLINTNCWTCESPLHYASECDVTHYNPLITKLTADSEQAQPRTDRYLRLDRIKWSTIKYQVYLTSQLDKSKLQQPIQPVSSDIIHQASIRASIISDKPFLQSNIKQQLSKEATKILNTTRIHKEYKDFDRPYAFKYYFPKNNFQNMKAFENYQNISKIINVRRSTFLPPIKTNVRQSTIFAWQKQY